jgi:hypothetical protein
MKNKDGWTGSVTYIGIDGWTQTEYGTLIPPFGFSHEDTEFSAVAIDSEGVVQFALPSNNKRKCAHCGQWGEPRSACEYCGAPVD